MITAFQKKIIFIICTAKIIPNKERKTQMTKTHVIKMISLETSLLRAQLKAFFKHYSKKTYRKVPIHYYSVLYDLYKRDYFLPTPSKVSF